MYIISGPDDPLETCQPDDLSPYAIKSHRRELMKSAHLKGSVDRIICDPPFLSEDCQTKSRSPIWYYRI